MAETVCLVMAHGNIASALVDASKKIVGDCEQLSVYDQESNFVERNIEAEGILILVCIKGGSYWNTAVRVSREYDNVKVIAGVNLSMILSFISKRDQFLFDELANVLLDDARRGVVILDTGEV